MTDLYVDPSGSDAANGLTPATAVATLAHGAALMGGGDRLLLKRGGTWREQLTVPTGGTAQAPTVIAAYGTGDRPVVKGSAALTNASFALKGNAPAIPAALWVEPPPLVRPDGKLTGKG